MFTNKFETMYFFGFFLMFDCCFPGTGIISVGYFLEWGAYKEPVMLSFP